MHKIGCAGTYDPITEGHMWVIGEARNVASHVVVYISDNPSKVCRFSAEKRKDITEQSMLDRGWENVSVEILRAEYTAIYAKQNDVEYLFKGIRDETDFNYENLIQQTNVDVLGGAKTIFVMPPRDLGAVSSSFVKALQGPAGWHWHVKKFVPAPAYRALIGDWLEREWLRLFGSSDRANSEFLFLCGPQSYGGDARYYHNLEHLVHGLSEIHAWAANTGATKEVVDTLCAAFWYHDAVYGTKSDISDEEASARRWESTQLLAGRTEEVANLIRVTDHLQSIGLEPAMKNVMLGADLAILGQSPDVYAAYANAIRNEYSYVGEAAYRQGRANVLEHLLHKLLDGELLEDPWFAKRYQAQAETNLEQEIKMLRVG